MKVSAVIGVFFLVLGAIFAVAARANRHAPEQRTVVARTRGRMAVIFTIVGTGLLLYELIL